MTAAGASVGVAAWVAAAASAAGRRSGERLVPSPPTFSLVPQPAEPRTDTNKFSRLQG